MLSIGSFKSGLPPRYLEFLGSGLIAIPNPLAKKSATKCYTVFNMVKRGISSHKIGTRFFIEQEDSERF